MYKKLLVLANTKVVTGLSTSDFTFKDGNMENIGAGHLEVNCYGNLKADIEGSGKVFYQANPELNLDIIGSGSVVNAN